MHTCMHAHTCTCTHTLIILEFPRSVFEVIPTSFSGPPCGVHCSQSLWTVSLTMVYLGKAMQENPGYLRLRKIRAAQAIANTVSHILRVWGLYGTLWEWMICLAMTFSPLKGFSLWFFVSVCFMICGSIPDCSLSEPSLPERRNTHAQSERH